MGLRFAVYLVSAAIASAVAAAGCGPAKSSESRTRVTTASSGARDIVVIATERSDRGGRLVGVSVDGSRQTELTELGGMAILDRSPVVSADGKWVVFASNRDRDGLPDTSLWRISARGGTPIRLTGGAHIDRDPRLSPDGRWLYFCSDRGGTFDLYRASFDGATGTAGAAEAVVESDGQILSPSLSPDGAEVVFMELDGEGSSRLWRASADGSTGKVALSDGPADLTPAWGPNGWIAFAARAPGREDADVYLMPAGGGKRKAVLDTTITDETGPRWSKDGRYLFAIGMYRSASDGKPLLGSIIVLDRKEQIPQWRALHDPATVETRIGLGPMPVTLNAEALHLNKNYKAALTEVLRREARRNESRRSREQR